jgi:hypothetical protein
VSLKPLYRAPKPLDFSSYGDGLGINGSVDRSGRIIAINSYHAEHGYVTVTTALPFTEEDRYDSTSVRRYRAGLSVLKGFGYTFDTKPRQLDVDMLDGVIPHLHFDFNDSAYADCVTFVIGGGVIQQWDCHNIRPRWSGRISLQRCAYAQITEGGPLLPAPVIAGVSVRDDAVIITNPALPHAVAILGLDLGEANINPDSEGCSITATGRAGRSTLIYGLGANPEEALRQAQHIDTLDATAALQHQRRQWRDRWHSIPDSPIIRRGLSYSLAMAIPVDEDICLLTDHMLLPLAWNRDAYYAARALLSWWPDAMAWVMRGHLLWMFEQTERVNGAWGRCYLANGKLKDGAFQLDQQLFPLLELAEYVLETGDHATYDRLRGHIQPMLDMLFARRHNVSDALLLPTDETPADDPIHYPYHLSSHLLLWRVLNMLHQLTNDPQWQTLATQTANAIHRYFVAQHDGEQLYAYATDANGHHHFYHDANDLPLVLAPLWGLIDANDPIWQATLRFAFSDRNVGGFYDGHLGSVHTPAPWALGDLQALIAADATSDQAGALQAWENLKRAAQWDGSLPEGYEASTGTTVARHWFAWPNAALAWYAHERRNIQPPLA